MGLKRMSLILGFLAIQFLGGLLCMARGDVLHYDFVVSTSFPSFFFFGLIFGCNLQALLFFSFLFFLFLTLLRFGCNLLVLSIFC
jgi:hypothetical protein